MQDHSNNSSPDATNPISPGLVESWQLISAEHLAQAAEQVIHTFEHTYHADFEDAWMGVNHKLSVELRGFKLVDGWLTGFLLTPWMLATLYIPLENPAIEIDQAWSVQNQQSADYVVIGPLKTFELGGQAVKANLNYDKSLGHYLLQPLVQVMDKYQDNEQAFGAWSQVIQFRQAHYAKLQLEREELRIKEQDDKIDAPENVDRRQFLSKWLT